MVKAEDDDDDLADELALRAVEAGAANAYLRAKTRVLEAEYERLHLGHFREWMYTALEILVGLILFLIFAALASAVYKATQADGLVIESFSAPPDLVQKGLTGPVLASKLLDRLNAMQGNTSSSRAASSFSHDWTNDIKVEIPNTGVSLGEVIRYLHNWLGHEMHLSGDLYETDKGVVFTVRLDGEPGQSFQGSAADLDRIMQLAAEAVYRRAQPYRYSVFLRDHGRYRDSEAVLIPLSENGPPHERAWADMGLALSRSRAGRNVEAEQLALHAIAENPEMPNAAAALSNIAEDFGHDEDRLRHARKVSADLETDDGARELAPDSIASFRGVYGASAADVLGDYRLAIANIESASPSFTGTDVYTGTAIEAVLLHDPAAARARLSALEAANLVPDRDTDPPADVAIARAQIAMSTGDWRSAASFLEQALALAHSAALAAPAAFGDTPYRNVFAGPRLAYVYAKLGAFDKADAIAKALPFDCDVCLRTRGNIAALKHDWRSAAYWFAIVAARAPSIPFADADWGAMLLRKGDLDGAIAKFESANKKGPHFADPLEMWGEALMAKNRSDLALAKFEEANSYAPNWGRLHLKWGEALLWSGDKVGAGKQFAIASSLDLSAADKSELDRVAHG